MPMSLPSKITCPDVGLAMPLITSSSSDWPLPETPAMPTISPARTLKETLSTRAMPFSSFQVRFLTSSTASPGFAGPFSTRSSTRRPTISSASSSTLVSLVSRGRHHLAAAHDRDAVGDGHDLAQLVGDEDDGLALVAQRAEDAEQVIGLVRRQHAGGLVEDQDVGAAVERLEDLDALLQADGQVADQRVGIDVEFVVAAPGACSSARALASAGPMQRAALGAEHDVLQHGEGIDQHEVLVHHADAQRDGIRRRS